MTQNTARPVVEIAGYRDPDGDVDLVVFVNGEQYDGVLWDIVDPGRGYPYPLSEWRESAWSAARAGSRAYASMITAYYESAEEAYTTDDMFPATDVQPEVRAVADLDPSLWFRVPAGPNVANGRSAASGVVAVKVFHTIPDRDPIKAAKAAVRAYRTTHWGYDNESLPTALVDLLTDLRHFADAREIRLEARPHWRNEIAVALVALVDALREAASTEAWAAQLQQAGLTFDDAEAAAFRRSLQEVTVEAAAHRRHRDKVTSQV